MIDEKIVTKIGKLARIKVEESEKAAYAREITTIVKWLEQLGEVNTDNVPQMASVVETALPLRDDVVTDGGYAKAIISNAPKSEFDCFVVPKVVDQG